jgi:signal recognition particle subunit SEC65
MKCIKNQKTGEIKRVTNEDAYQMETRGWSYIPKSEWKDAVGQPVVEAAKRSVQGKKSKKN